MTADELLQRLQGVKRTGSGYMARCPAHADHTASLHVGAGDDGSLMLHCFAGCATAGVVASLHLTMSDLFPTKTPRDAIVAAYDYRDECGTLLYQTVQLVPKAFRQRRPYGASGWVNESNEGACLNVSQVKWIVGGGTIWARPLHGQPVTFKPHYLLLLETNNLHANADDYALRPRLLLRRFTQSYIDDPRKANEHPRDLHLRATLEREASGILAWLVRGALAYQHEGLHPPDGVKLATESYQAEEDTLGQSGTLQNQGQR